MILALLVGCGVDCGEGETLTRDGCVPAAQSAGWDEETLPGHRLRECQMQPGDGELDLQAGCANNVCIGDSYGTFASRLGTPTDIDSSGSTVWVRWDDEGMYGVFRDEDDDDQADDAGLPLWFSVDDRAAGASVEGLRVDVSLACFVQVLGQPDDVDTEDGLPQTLWYDALGLRVSDYVGDQVTITNPDGYVDVISFDERR